MAPDHDLAGDADDEASSASLDARHAVKMAKKKAARDRIMAEKSGEKGLIIVHTGAGKGKSSSAFGMILRWRAHLEKARWFLWCALLSFPTGFIAVLAGWFTAEVGRQPWVVYGLLRTRDAVTPSLVTGDVFFSLAGYVVVYALFISFGFYYIYKLLREGPTGEAKPISGATPNRPLAFADDAASATGSQVMPKG